MQIEHQDVWQVHQLSQGLFQVKAFDFAIRSRSCFTFLVASLRVCGRTLTFFDGVHVRLAEVLFGQNYRSVQVVQAVVIKAFGTVVVFELLLFIFGVLGCGAGLLIVPEMYRVQLSAGPSVHFKLLITT